MHYGQLIFNNGPRPFNGERTVWSWDKCITQGKNDVGQLPQQYIQKLTQNESKYELKPQKS